MVRQVRGLGTLVPENIRWIAARTAGRVEQILLRPGAQVQADSVILILNNPDVQEASLAADSQLNAAETELANLDMQLHNDLIEAEAAVAEAESNYEIAVFEAQSYKELFDKGVESELRMRQSQVRADNAKRQHAIEQKRFTLAEDSIELQLAVKRADVEQKRAQARLRREELEALHVRAAMNGILQSLGDPQLQVGQQVTPGTNLARVADPLDLKAEVRIAETQAKDIQHDQIATIDTRNGVVEGRVSRIDPAVLNGTVTVDIVLTGKLPRGARPDLSVDGTIELDRLDDVVYVGRPAFGQEDSTVGIYKLSPDGNYAERTQVQLGRSSVNTIEIIAGLHPNDQVILSDMSQWDTHDRVRLK